MVSDRHLLIIGNGCGGTELAFAARASGWAGPITLIGDEPHEPYHRPPLSKAYLVGAAELSSLGLRGTAAYATAQITLLARHRAVAIHRSSKQVELADGRRLPYDHLVLALGGRPRPLPFMARQAENPPRNLHYLRTHDDARAIRDNLHLGRRLVVIGGGYIGLEVAAAAVKSGMQVAVLEAGQQLLGRVAAAPVAAFYGYLHRSAGVDIRTSVQVQGFEFTPDGAIHAVVCADGTRLPADVVVAGIGLLPNSELASEAGLSVDDGIIVDERLATSDPGIMAIGDCARGFSTLYQRSVRIESVPNALEQARKAAALLCDKPPRPDTAPWFWSDQYSVSLKAVGLSQGYDRLVIRGEPQERDFSAFYLKGKRILAVDTVNRAQEFQLCKAAVLQRLEADPEALADETLPLKSIFAMASHTHAVSPPENGS
ncbi:NAD(P)/FAD-dependent oxidoreductase [Pseudomonas typographi]|uniref:FAD-dependent oxidoreductase n=1 Tax=Pseudomonas typographi TaxID=2715964 RepID=A0ABR7Z235_9PSED|nr:FAD-dependent oxidoreductase [Pseudomonas typographi]MBD1599424.1 FAD-dependent oxidoreductase [Pseudomonas typographi]